MNITTAELCFLPEEQEKSEELLTLFSDVNKLIATYMTQNPEKDEKVIRRFVAGDVCREDLNHFVTNFRGVREGKGKITPWSKFVQKEVVGSKRKFSEMTEMSKDFVEFKKTNPSQYEIWEAECAAENVSEKKTEESQLRQTMYKKAFKNLRKLCVDMLEDFDTHVLIYMITDTHYRKHYPSEVYFNSGKLSSNQRWMGE